MAASAAVSSWYREVLKYGTNGNSESLHFTQGQYWYLFKLQILPLARSYIMRQVKFGLHRFFTKITEVYFSLLSVI